MAKGTPEKMDSPKTRHPSMGKDGVIPTSGTGAGIGTNNNPAPNTGKLP